MTGNLILRDVTRFACTWQTDAEAVALVSTAAGAVFIRSAAPVSGRKCKQGNIEPGACTRTKTDAGGTRRRGGRDSGGGSET